jgi:hypothetical protein
MKINVLRFFYSSAILLTMHSMAYSMDKLSLDQQNKLHEAAKQRFMNGSVPRYERAQTQAFFQAYTENAFGQRCSHDPTRSCFLVMNFVKGGHSLPLHMEQVIANSMEVDKSSVSELYEQFRAEYDRNNKSS